jgi:hypothetical protein
MWGKIISTAATWLGSAGKAGKVSAYLKANPWVGDVASYAIQRRDTNRAHRRQMTDLKRAGINPILSAKLGGAATPTMASMGQTMNTARQIDQTEKTTNAQVEKLKEEVAGLTSENVLKQAIADFYKTEQGKKLIPTKAAGGSTLNPVNAIMTWITGPSGTEPPTKYPEKVLNGIKRTIELQSDPEWYPND